MNDQIKQELKSNAQLAYKFSNYDKHLTGKTPEEQSKEIHDTLSVYNKDKLTNGTVLNTFIKNFKENYLGTQITVETPEGETTATLTDIIMKSPRQASYALEFTTQNNQTLIIHHTTEGPILYLYDELKLANASRLYEGIKLTNPLSEILEDILQYNNARPQDINKNL